MLVVFPGAGGVGEQKARLAAGLGEVGLRVGEQFAAHAVPARGGRYDEHHQLEVGVAARFGEQLVVGGVFGGQEVAQLVGRRFVESVGLGVRALAQLFPLLDVVRVRHARACKHDALDDAVHHGHLRVGVAQRVCGEIDDAVQAREVAFGKLVPGFGEDGADPIGVVDVHGAVFDGHLSSFATKKSVIGLSRPITDYTRNELHVNRYGEVLRGS